MSRSPTINIQVPIMTKWLTKCISTNVFFTTTIRKRHVYNYIGWPWIWKQWFYLGIWNHDRTKTIVLPSFQLATRLNSQNTKENEIINVSNTIIFLWIFPIGIIEVSTSRKWCFLFYFSSLRDYGPPSTWHSLVKSSWVEMERCE